MIYKLYNAINTADIPYFISINSFKVTNLIYNQYSDIGT